MSEMLAETLQSLQNLYIRRARSTAALIAGLKGTNSTLNKTNRALSDYISQNTFLDENLLMQAQQTFDGLQFKDNIAEPLLPHLRREAKALAVQLAALKEAVNALQGEMVDVIRLDHAYQALQSSPLQDAELTALLPDLSQTLEEAQARLGDEFGAALRDEMATIGIEVSGRPPRFEVGRFEILANFVNRTASISYGKIQVVPKVKLSLDAIIKAYQQESKIIEARKEDGQHWIEQLHQAWELARLKSERATARVNIIDCYYELVLLRQGRNFYSAPSKRSFVDYSRAQFAFDFDTFTRRQRLTAQGQVAAAHVATKSQAESASKSLWIVEGNSPHEGRYVGDIEFAKG